MNVLAETSILLHVTFIYSIIAISLFCTKPVYLLISLLFALVTVISWAISGDRCLLNDLTAKFTGESYMQTQSRFASLYIPFDSKFVRPILYLCIFISIWKFFDRL